MVITGSLSELLLQVDDQQVKMNSPRKKMQTMADRFQEALGSSSVINEASHVGALNSLRYKILVSCYFYAIKN